MRRVLIDTNILVFLFTDTLDSDTDALVRGYENQVFVSSVSVMEFIHLVRSERVKLHKAAKFDVFEFIEKNLAFEILYPTHKHLEMLDELPLVTGHNDPNDRLIISQAMADKLELVSSDLKFVHYRKYGLQLFQAEKQG